MHGSSLPEVLFYLPQLGGGGAEMNAVRLAEGLLKNGLKPVYAVARGPGSYAEFLPPEAEVVVLDTGEIESSTLRLLRSLRPLARLIDERHPAVVCPVMALQSVLVLAALKRTEHKPAVALCIQNSLKVSYGQGAGLRNRLELALMRRTFPKADAVVALSEGVAEDLRQHFPSIAARVTVIPNVGVPTRRQASSACEPEAAPAGEAMIILACGRLTEQKDYPTLLRAFKRIAEHREARLEILGDGELRTGLEHLARDLGIAERTSFLGFRDDPLAYMRRANVFVLSSRWEGFGNVLIEAMSVGTPVVSTNCPHGPSEIIADGETGLLVPTEDSEALARAVLRLAESPELRERIGKAGQRRAQDFTVERVGRAYAELFHRVARAA